MKLSSIIFRFSINAYILSVSGLILLSIENRTTSTNIISFLIISNAFYFINRLIH